MRGLGDVVAAITKAVGIKPCPPCERRREALNKAVPNPFHKPAPAPAPAPPQGKDGPK